MDWIGIDHGTGRLWGPDGPLDAERPARLRLIAGPPDAQPDKVPGAILPEQPHRDNDALILPALGTIPGSVRLRLTGFRALNPHWDGLAVIVTPDRTLWITLSAGEAIHMQGSMTGRLAQALDCTDTKPEGVDDALSRPERLAMFLHDATLPGQRLGALIGADLAAARGLWLGQQAVLIGTGPLAAAHAAALEGQHVPLTRTTEDALVREGFRALAAAGKLAAH